MTRTTSIRTRVLLAAVLCPLASLLTACSAPPRPATLTLRNDATQAIDLHYAVLAPDGNPAVAGEAGVQHMTVPAGGAATQEIADPTEAIGKAPHGSTIVRAFVTLAGAQDVLQVVDLEPPGPFVLRASPHGTGVRVEREAVRDIDDRQIRDLTHEEPPQPGRAGRP